MLAHEGLDRVHLPAEKERVFLAPDEHGKLVFLGTRRRQIDEVLELGREHVHLDIDRVEMAVPEGAGVEGRFLIEGRITDLEGVRGKVRAIRYSSSAPGARDAISS